MSPSGLSRRAAAEQPQHQLQEGDLLGSFDDDPLDRPPSRPSEHASAKGTAGASPRTEPIHVKLPPRPTEISPDYQPPPARSPRRLSQPYTFAGPSSPPLVSDIGNEIVFHPATSQVAIEPNSPRRRTSFNTWTAGSPTRQDSTSYGGAHSKLLGTLTSTQKIASKWRHALDPAHYSPPSTPERDPAPMDVNHTTPFATQTQVAGSYTPPSGAPSFRPSYGAQSFTSPDVELSTIRLRGRREDAAVVLRSSEGESLRQYLPPRQRLESTWNLLFSLDQHGSSLATLYRLTERSPRGAGNLLVALAANGCKFGVFMNEAIVRKEGAYYGTGESFLFKLSENGIRVFAWTGRNQYFALCESGFISFGGGGGAFGLILDATFHRNSSATSPAFDNEILCDSKEIRSERAQQFECIGLEIWATA